MKITNFTVGRVLSDGNYGSKKLEVTVEITNHKETENEIKYARAYVETILNNGEIPEVEVVEEEKPKNKLVRKSKEQLEEAKAEAEPKKKAAKKTAKKAVKKSKSKAVPYNRDLDAHKSYFKRVLNEIDDTWKIRAKKAGIETSRKMEGEDMFPSLKDDTILDSFKEQAEKVYLKLAKELKVI